MVFPLVRCYGPNLKTDRWLVVIDQVQKRVSVGGDERSAFPPPGTPRSLPRAPVAMAIPGGVNKVQVNFHNVKAVWSYKIVKVI